MQRWLDHEAREARLVVAVAGSSQRTMQGLVLASDAPLFGRAKEVLEVGPIDPAYLREALGAEPGADLVERYAAWGGVPRYWELAAEAPAETATTVERLVLDPLGPLHREPDSLLMEEIPSAVETRPVLDAIGAGAHRVSEIAGRLGRPATSMARPLERLLGMGLVIREIPFGEEEKRSRRSLYKIGEPFFRLWFQVVAPNRGRLASSTREGRLMVLDRVWSNLLAQAWEDVCRSQLPRLPVGTALGDFGPWGPASRWWRGEAPEWDLVSESLDGDRLLLGEAKWSGRPFGQRDVDRACRQLAAKPAPPLPKRYQGLREVRALFVPDLAQGTRHESEGALVVSASELLPLPQTTTP